jgi:hypothetical protein
MKQKLEKKENRMLDAIQNSKVLDLVDALYSRLKTRIKKLEES